MIDDIELLHLQAPVGKGQENNPDDVEALDGRLRSIRAYAPPPEYADNAQRYATEPMVSALERYQERHGLKIDGVALPGGPTERAINNELLEKPRGAGLLYNPPSALAGTVGNGFENRHADVAGVKRRLGALGHLPEDPFDKPHGFIDEATTNGIRAFQRAKGLVDDGWLAPNGETERALNGAIGAMTQAKEQQWFAYAARANDAQSRYTRAGGDFGSSGTANESIDIEPATFDPRYPFGFGKPMLEGGWIRVPGGMGSPRRVRGSDSSPRPPAPPFGVPIPEPEQPRTDDAPAAPTRPQQPFPGPGVHVPQPGSPLRIPIVDHRYGRRGHPNTIQTTDDVIDTIKKECTPILNIPGIKLIDSREWYYPRKDDERGGSFADGLFRIKIGELMVDFVADTYTPNADGKPNSGEESRFLKFQKNAHDKTFVIRVPKAWQMGQSLDKEKLSEATREICEQIRNMLDGGELAPGKEPVFKEKLLDNLVKPKPKRSPVPKDAPDPRP